MKIIDSHVHMGLDAFRNRDEKKLKYNLENSFEEYYSLFKDNHLSMACILPIPSLEFDSYKSNEYLLKSWKLSKGMFLPICRMDKQLGYNLNNGFYGVKLHKVYEKYKKNDLLEYLRMLQLYNKPLIIHAAFKDKPKQIKNILRAVPELKIILAHMGRGHLYTSEGVIENAQALEDYKNVYFETSTVGNSSTIEKVCKIIGSKRIMFGSDYPFGKIYAPTRYKYEDEFDVINNAQITEIEKQDIFFNTAYEVFFKGYQREKIYLTHYQKKYKADIEKIFKSLSEQDKNFLAIRNKISVIRNCMRKENHIYVIFYENEIVGFLRESGRPKGYSLLEELVIHPQFRGKGIASESMQLFKKLFPLCLAKTNAQNNIMNYILKKNSFKRISGERIINWELN